MIAQIGIAWIAVPKGSVAERTQQCNTVNTDYKLQYDTDRIVDFPQYGGQDGIIFVQRSGFPLRTASAQVGGDSRLQ